MKLKDRITAVLWLFVLTIWRLIIEIFRGVVLIIFFIPMIFSTKVHEVFGNFIYETLEEDEHNTTIRDESESDGSNTELHDNRPVEVGEELH